MAVDTTQFGWQRFAACKGVPSYLFFPDERELPGFKSEPEFEGRTAEDYCNNCIVKFKCREFAVLHDQNGIWGDSTERERGRRYVKEERWEMRNQGEDLGTFTPLYGHR